MVRERNRLILGFQDPDTAPVVGPIESGSTFTLVDGMVEVAEGGRLGMQDPEGVLHVECPYQLGQTWGHLSCCMVCTILLTELFEIMLKPDDMVLQVEKKSSVIFTS